MVTLSSKSLARLESLSWPCNTLTSAACSLLMALCMKHKSQQTKGWRYKVKRLGLVARQHCLEVLTWMEGAKVLIAQPYRRV